MSLQLKLFMNFLAPPNNSFCIQLCVSVHVCVCVWCVCVYVRGREGGKETKDEVTDLERKRELGMWNNRKRKKSKNNSGGLNWVIIIL